MKLVFNPTPAQCQQVANACMSTPDKCNFLNAYQPFKVPSVQALANMINSPALLLSAIGFVDNNEIPVGYIFCGNYFSPHMAASPHLGFGISRDHIGKFYGSTMLLMFCDELRRRKLTTILYGHCYKSNIAACRSMEKSYMTGKSIGIQPYSHGNEVMDYFMKL